MRKTLAFLLTLIMAVSAFTAAFAGTAEIKNGENALLANGLTFYACLLGKGGGDIRFGFGEYYLESDTARIYPNIDAERMFSAVYVKTPDDEGIYAQFERIDNTGYVSDEVLVRFDDIEAFKAGNYVEIGKAPCRITAMAMDYSTNTVFAMDEDRTLYRLDRQSGTFIPAADIKTSRLPIVMSIDDNGDIYVITYGGLLFKVDKISGDATEIGSTGVSPEYQQSMTYDYNTRTMYWFMTDESGGFGDYGTYTVNLETAQVKKLNKSADCTVLGAFTVPEVEIPIPDAVPVSGMDLSRTELSMIARQTFHLVATVYPLDAYVNNRSVSYKSSNNAVATVSAGGMITANKAGTAVITATTPDGKYTKECKVTVTDMEEAYRDISDVLNDAKYGDDDYVLYVTDKSETGYPFTVSGAAVYSSNSGVGNSVSYVETAYPVKLVGGSTVKFSYTVSSDKDDLDGFYFYVNGRMLDPESDDYDYEYRGEIPWTTYEYKVPRTGEYTFRWEYNKNYSRDSGDDRMGIGYIKYIMADVSPVRSMAITPNSAEVLTGKTLQLTAEFTPNNVAFQNVTFKSDNEKIAKVSESGLVTGVSEGVVRITATAADGHTASANVTVKPVNYVENMKFTPVTVGNTYDFELNQYVNFSGQIKLAAGYSIEVAGGEGVIIDLFETGKDPVTDTTLYVYDEDFNVVAYNEDDPYDFTTFYSYLRFAPTAKGTHRYNIVVTTRLTYEFDYGTCSMTLAAFEPVHVERVTVPNQNVTLKPGQISKIQVLLTPAENDYPTVMYESSDTSVVTVSENGLMSAVAIGTATVTVYVPDGDHTLDVKVNVTEDGVGSKPEYDGSIYGFSLYTDEYPKGFLKYDPSGYGAELEPVALDESSYYAGVYYDGMIYAYSYELYENDYQIRYVKLDAQTFTVQSTQILDITCIPTDLTYDYSTDTVYATVQDLSNGTPYFGTIDLATGEFTSIAVWRLPRASHIILNIEAATDGTLYGIGTDGWLYEINKTSGTVTALYDMTIKTSWVNTMVFDHYTQTMYWFPFTEKGGGQVVAFDPVTGDTAYVEDIGSSMTEISCGMIFADRNTFPELDYKTYTVTFTDFDGNVAAEVQVREGRQAQAPVVKHPDGIKFMGWDKDITRVYEDMTVKPLALGDANRDGGVNAGDATLILRDVVGSAKLNEDNAPYADANGNGGIDTADATIVLRYVVSKNWGGQRDS